MIRKKKELIYSSNSNKKKVFFLERVARPHDVPLELIAERYDALDGKPPAVVGEALQTEAKELTKWDFLLILNIVFPLAC